MSHGHTDIFDVPPAPPALRHLLTAVVAGFIALTLLGVVLLWPQHRSRGRPRSMGPPVQLVNATVDKITSGPCIGSPPELDTHCMHADLRVTSGPDKATHTQIEIGESADQPTLHRGDRIVLGRSVEETGHVTYYFSDYQRRSPLLLLAIVFSLLVVGLARWKGAAAILGLIVSLLILVWFVLPSILDGHSPVMVSIVGAALMLIVVIYATHGIDLRSTTALLGTGAALVITGVLALIFVQLTQLSGLASEEMTYLRATLGHVDPQGLLLGGIIIGALGVLNDVTVTQASAVWEIYAADPSASPRQVYRSAMRIGRDHIAATVDTIVLAYAGAALPLLVLFTLSDRGFSDVITGEIVAEEVVRSLVGSIGLVASVPITTALGVFLVTRLKASKRPSS
jgi:uncharacterized membrane protein